MGTGRTRKYFILRTRFSMHHLIHRVFLLFSSSPLRLIHHHSRSREPRISLPLESNTESNRLSKRTHPCIPNQTCICVFLFQKYNPLNINLSRTKKLFPFTEIKITTSSSFDPILAICYKTPCTDRGGAVQLGAADEGGRVVTRKPSCVMALSSVRCFHPSNYPQIH